MLRHGGNVAIATPRIQKIQQTCLACPSQWDAWEADSTYYYIRYRYGTLTVSTDEDRVQLVELVVGDDFDGLMTFPEMVAHLHDVLDFSEVEEVNLIDWRK